MATLDGFYSSLPKPARPNGSALLSKVPVVGAASTAVKVVPVMGPDVANQAGRALQQQHQHHYQHQYHQHHQHHQHQAQQRPVAATSGVVNNGQETITTTTGTIGTTGTDGGIVMVPHIHSHPATGQTNPPSYRQVFPQHPQKQSQQQQAQQQHQHQHQHQHQQTQHAHPKPFPQPHHFSANTPTAGYAVGARDSDILRSSALCVGRPFRLRIANDSSAKVQYQIKATTRCGCSACAGWLKKTSLTLLGHSAKTFEINSSVQLTLKCRCAYNPTVKHKLVAQYRGDEVIGMCTAAATATTGTTTTTTTTAATMECADGDCSSTKAAPCVIMSVIHDAVYQAQLLGYAHGHGENVQRPIQMTYAQQLERREQEHRQGHHPDQRPSHQQTEEVSEKRPFSSNEPVVLVRGPDGKEFLTLESELPYLQLPLPPLPTTAAATATNGNPVGKGNAPPIFIQQPSGAEPVKEPYNMLHDTSFNASGISASNTLHQPPSQMYPISYGIEDRKMYCRGRPRQLVISSLEPMPFTAYSVCGCNVCQFWQEQSMVSHNGLSQSNSQSSPLLKSIGDAGRVDVSEQPLYSSTFNITSCVDVTFDFECQKVVGNRHRLIPPTIPDAPWNLGCKDGCYTMELIPQ